jgi:hypothetical protein
MGGDDDPKTRTVRAHVYVCVCVCTPLSTRRVQANARKFAPSNHSIIHVNDFADVRQLADYLLFLDGNDTEYERYLSWKRDGE